MTFSEKIRELCKEKNKEPNEVALEAGIKCDRFYSWYCGNRYANKKELKKLEAYSGWTYAYWTSEEPIRKYNMIRNIIWIIGLTVTFILSFIAISMFASVSFAWKTLSRATTITKSDCTYGLSHYELSLGSYSGKEDTLDIPEYIDVWHGISKVSYPVTSIDLENLLTNENLKHIQIPKTVDSIKLPYWIETVPDSYNLLTITIDPMNPTFDSRNNCNAIIKTETNELIFGAKNCRIPASVKKIAYGALSTYEKENLVIPEGVEIIQQYAFYYAKIKSLTLPSTLAEIDGCAFWHVDTLEEVFIPKTCNYYGTGAFSEKTIIYDECTKAEAEYPNDVAYYYSETAPTNPGRYWHYDENHNRVIWE